MFNKGNMIQALARSTRANINVYLNTDNVNQINVSQAQALNSLLSDAKTRAIGLRFLVDSLTKYPQNVSQDKASFWITILLKACNKKEINLYGELTYEALALLVKNFQNEADMSKWFGSTHLVNLYGTLSLITENEKDICTISILKALKECLKYYPGQIKGAKNVVIQYLIGLLNSSNQDVVYHSGCCWLLLQQERINLKNAGSLENKMQWQYYQNGILDNLNILLCEAFPTYENTYSSYSTDETNKFKFFMMKLDADPIKRGVQVCRRFCHLIEFLKIALSHPYPSNKLISPAKILHLIQRGFGMSYTDCLHNPNVDNTFLGHLLPHMNTKLFELLKLLINICHTQLRMHFRLITELLLVALRSTKSSSLDGSHPNFYNLRSKVYEVITLWLSVFVEGSGYDLIVDNLMENIVEDIKIIKTNSKHTYKSKPKESNSTTFTQPSNRVARNDENKDLVCQHALRCLQTVIASVGYLLKPSLLKEIFNTVVEIAIICKSRTTQQHSYNNWLCRLEMYKTLSAFITFRNLRNPPPTEIILHLLNESFRKDQCLIIRVNSKHMIESIERIVHAQKDNFIFQLHIDDIIDMSNSALSDLKSQQNEVFEKQISNFERTEDAESFQLEIESIATISNAENCSDFIPVEKIKKSSEMSKLMGLEHQENIEELTMKTCSGIKKGKTSLKLEKQDLNDGVYSATSINQRIYDDDKYVAELEAAFVDELV